MKSEGERESTRRASLNPDYDVDDDDTAPGAVALMPGDEATSALQSAPDSAEISDGTERRGGERGRRRREQKERLEMSSLSLVSRHEISGGKRLCRDIVIRTHSQQDSRRKSVVSSERTTSHKSVVREEESEREVA